MVFDMQFNEMNQEMVDMLEQLDSSRFHKNIGDGEMHYVDGNSEFLIEDDNNDEENMSSLPIEFSGNCHNQIAYLDNDQTRIQAPIPRSSTRTVIGNAARNKSI